LILSLLVIAALATGAIRVPRLVLQRGVRTQLNFACGAFDARSRAGLLYGLPKNWGYRYTYNNRPKWLLPSGPFGSILSGVVPNSNLNTVLSVNYNPLSGVSPVLNGVQKVLLTIAGAPTVSGVVGDLATLFRGVFNSTAATITAVQGANTILVPVLKPQLAPLGASLFFADGERIQIGPDFISAQTVAGPNGAAAGDALRVRDRVLAGLERLEIIGRVHAGDARARGHALRARHRPRLGASDRVRAEAPGAVLQVHVLERDGRDRVTGRHVVEVALLIVGRVHAAHARAPLAVLGALLRAGVAAGRADVRRIALEA